MSIEGRTVLVVGLQSFGWPIARLLAKAGARVLLHRNPQQAETTGHDLDSIEQLSDPLDSIERAEALVAKCWESFGPLSGLVVVPEEASADDFADGDEDWRDAMHAALKIPFFLTRAVAERMSKATGGCIVHLVGADSHDTDETDTLAVNEVIRSASITMTLSLAKAFPDKVRICALVRPAGAPSASGGSGIGSGIAQTVLLLLGEESLGSGVIVRLDANRR